MTARHAEMLTPPELVIGLGQVREAAKLGQAEELVAPQGLVLAIWSRIRPAISSSRRQDGAWQSPIPAALRVDDRIYPDDFVTEKPDLVRFAAVTAGIIRTELSNDQTSPGTIYAYPTTGTDTRYDITDPAYVVGLLPEPSGSGIFVRHQADPTWSQVSFS